MRRGAALVALAAIMLATFGVVPAGAKTGPKNSWTQADNGAWPQSAHGPDCGPCLKWPNGEYEYRWSYGFGDDKVYHPAARAAVNEWSGQMYKSPMFSETGHSCVNSSYENLCVRGNENLKSTYCGASHVSWTTGNLIYYGWAELNSGRHDFHDGPPPAETGGCDIRTVWYHEVGHAYGEGHSSVYTDLMCGYLDGSCRGFPEHVDADAQGMLKAVYGPVSGESTCSDCPSAPDSPGGCPTCSVWYRKVQALEKALTLSPPSGKNYPVPAAA
jgi:hypothetical protein